MGSQRTFVFSGAPSRTEWGSRLLLAAPLVVLLLAAGVQAVRLPALTMLVVGLVVLRLTAVRWRTHGRPASRSRSVLRGGSAGSPLMRRMAAPGRIHCPRLRPGAWR